MILPRHLTLLIPLVSLGRGWWALVYLGACVCAYLLGEQCHAGVNLNLRKPRRLDHEGRQVRGKIHLSMHSTQVESPRTVTQHVVKGGVLGAKCLYWKPSSATYPVPLRAAICDPVRITSSLCGLIFSCAKRA